MENAGCFTTNEEQRYKTREERYNQAKNYEQGLGVEQNQIKAYQIYLQLAEEGCVLSQCWLGTAYLNNVFCPLYSQNFSNKSLIPEILELLKQSYEDNYESKYVLERIYKYNIYYARKWLTLAANNEHVDAIFALGEMHLSVGYGNNQDYAKAKEYFQLVIKLQPDHVFAKFRLGEIYSVEEDLPNALRLYQEAAEAGCSAALYTLGIRYEHGEGLEQDIALATELITKAAELGHAIAQYNLSMRYAVGEGVEQDSAKDIFWCLKAAAGGSAEAQNIIGLRYASGKGLDKDYSKAIMWYKKAIAQNLADAKFNLAEIYNNCDADALDVITAINLYKNAASQGHLEAKYMLGSTYKSLATSLKHRANMYDDENISLFEFYLNQSIKWYKEAAKQDHILAKFDLGMMYISQEIYVAPKVIESKKWLAEAAKQGHPTAQNRLTATSAKNNDMVVNINKKLKSPKLVY